jgi:two-component system response regulator DctR
MSVIRILPVEDDPMVAEVNQRYLEQIGGLIVVGMARTGKECLALAESLQPDLVLLDVYLPDLNGVSVLKEIRRLGLPVDVILVTAAHDVETVQESLRYGAIDYIIKPFRYQRLQSALNLYRQMHGRILAHGTFDQAQVDRLTMARRATDTILPKGLNDWTMRQVLLHLLKQEEPFSAAELGRRVGLSRVTIRRYLEYLCQAGKARIEVQYGGVGRPVNLYSAL